MNNIINTYPLARDAKPPEEIKMPNDFKKLLKELYVLRSYSGYEEPIRHYIMEFLNKRKIPFQNYNGNIIGFNHPGAPLFSAHMDMVNTEHAILRGAEGALDDNHVFTLDDRACIRLYRDKEKKHQTSLGADDKNGIWCILALLIAQQKINFAFCHSEEIGGAGSKQIMEHPDLAKFVEECAYGVIIDRRNSSDIIGYNNKYCLTLDDQIERFAKENGFKFSCTTGSISDADRFSEVLECVNLSCGYYSPHTSTEYTNLNELWNTYQFSLELLAKFNYRSASKNRMKEFKTPKTSYGSAYGSTYGSNSSYYSKYSQASKDKDSYDDDYYDYDYYYGRYKDTDEVKTTTKASSSISSIAKTVSAEKKSKEEKKDSQVNPKGESLRHSKGFPFLENIPDECIAELADGNASYDNVNDVWLVPFTTDKVPPDDVLLRPVCNKCKEVCTLTQQVIDDLYMGWYSSNKDRCYGVCMSCWNMEDITNEIKQLLTV